MYATMISGAKSDAVYYLLFTLLTVALTILFATACYSMFFKLDAEKDSRFDKTQYSSANVAIGTIFAVAGLVICIMIFMSFTTTRFCIRAFSNPEYYALMKILEFIKA